MAGSKGGGLPALLSQNALLTAILQLQQSINAQTQALSQNTRANWAGVPGAGAGQQAGGGGGPRGNPGGIGPGGGPGSAKWSLFTGQGPAGLAGHFGTQAFGGMMSGALSAGGLAGMGIQAGVSAYQSAMAVGTMLSDRSQTQGQRQYDAMRYGAGLVPGGRAAFDFGANILGLNQAVDIEKETMVGASRAAQGAFLQGAPFSNEELKRVVAFERKVQEGMEAERQRVINNLRDNSPISDKAGGISRTADKALGTDSTTLGAFGVKGGVVEGTVNAIQSLGDKFKELEGGLDALIKTLGKK